MVVKIGVIDSLPEDTDELLSGESNLFHHGVPLFQLISSGSETSVVPYNVDIQGEISESSVVSAIDCAIKDQADIINISLAFDHYSIILFEACQRAIDAGIFVIAASTRKKVCYPADFNGVLKIVQSDKASHLCRMDETVFINKSVVRDKLNSIFKDGRIIDSPSESSSMETAFATLRIAKYIHDYPLSPREKTLSSCFIELKDGKAKCIPEKMHLQDKAILIHPDDGEVPLEEYTSICSVDIKNIFHLPNDLERFEAHKSEYSQFVEINPSGSEQAALLTEYDNALFFGKLSGVVLSGTIACPQLPSNKIYHREEPIIQILSYCPNLSKMFIELSLLKYFSEDGYKTLGITYNPIGYCFDLLVLPYEEKIIFPDVVYKLSDLIDAQTRDQNYDVIVESVPGGYGSLNRFNDNCFGSLAKAHCDAVPVDILVLCIPCGLDPSIVLNSIKSLAYPKIFLVLTNRRIDGKTTQSSDGLKTIYADEKRVADTKSRYFPFPIYDMASVRNGKLYEDILDTLN